jgi:hypothetical protein
MTALAACPLSFGLASGPARDLESRPRSLLSTLVTDRAAAKRLGRLYVDALGMAPAIALVEEQEQRLVREAPQLSRASIAALIGADFRTGRIVDVGGLRMSRLESAALIASCLGDLPTLGIT